MLEENWRTRKKPAEASMDGKPNAHTVPGPGIEPGLSGVQCQGRTATPPASLLGVQASTMPTIPYKVNHKCIHV